MKLIIESTVTNKSVEYEVVTVNGYNMPLTVKDSNGNICNVKIIKETVEN